ncbi:MAG: hypothetical protein IPO92_14405 [Saprospiraceae bacterium]|nr:hypothetical protein [Saprospiraceae bacterium]
MAILTDCKNKSDDAKVNGSEAILNEALSIQDQAIHIGMSLDSLIDDRMAQGAMSQDIEALKKWKSKVNEWKYNMVEIPGIEHGHDHVDHTGHNHDHDHTTSDAASHLKPADIKKVQIEWKAAIEAIRDSIR